ncbi:MAG: SLC13 family permease, partial [Bacteroidota bacterium]
MTLEGWTVIGILVFCLTLLIGTSISLDLILFGGLSLILILGIVPIEVGLSGFSNEGMLTVGVLYVVAAGLKETGTIHMLTQRILGSTTSVTGAIARIMAPVMGMSALMNNTPIVASFIPAIERWGRTMNIPASKLLIPLSYAAILGGACTLIGTSTNLIVNGLLLEEPTVRGLGLFEPALVGIPCAVAGFLYLTLFGNILLPNRGSGFDSFKDPKEYTIEMEVNGPLDGQTVEKAGLRQLPGLFLVEVVRGEVSFPAISPDFTLKSGDRLIFAGIVDSIVDLQQIPGLQPANTQVFKLNSPKRERKLFEAVVSSSNSIVGRTIKEGAFRNRFNAVVLAVSRSGERVREKVGNITLKAGDTLLIEASANFDRRYRYSSEFYLISSLSGLANKESSKSMIAVLILLGMVGLAASGILSMFKAALLAGGALLATRVFRYSTALESIDWRVLVAIASSIGLGGALQFTGVAEHIAMNMLSISNDNPYFLLGIVYLCTWLLTEMITNTAAAVLMFPFAFSLASELGIDFVPFAIVMIMAASASFATPIG